MDEKQLLEKGKELFGKGMFLQAIEFFQVAIDSNSNGFTSNAEAIKEALDKLIEKANTLKSLLDE